MTFFHSGFTDAREAKRHTTHLAIVAHQDDAEIIGYSGIHACFQKEDAWFSSITLTNGGGASRGGKYQAYNNRSLAAVRQQEQLKAALLGEYAFCSQWATDSAYLKTLKQEAISELVAELQHCRPETIYTHNPFDKHATHVSAMKAVIEAVKVIRQSEPNYQPTLLGVEVWGGLDWLPESYLIELDCSPMPNLEQALIGLYDSQIDGNKSYDQAVIGRRVANATFSASHSSDTHRAVNFAIDLTPLISDPTQSLEVFAKPIIEKFTETKLHSLL